ncbi:uncharacterized protein FRV6_06607 [Fusarium oxysporum]|uniref:Uncharacterized protein n=1 Tax=Fusarium oxysporum TaxID=5507 RepID=A0A2H3TCI8_FUSOX|nr:uncharacterized protein FRV6_06607 [Fusarium oxysporum]
MAQIVGVDINAPDLPVIDFLH